MTTGVDPQTLVADDPSPTAFVLANQMNPSQANLQGGVLEFHNPFPIVGLNGSGTADSPYLLIHLNTAGRSSILVSYTVRDLDSSTDNALQQVALHYRVGNTGPFTNIPAAYIADATSGPSEATLVTPVSAMLPAAANDQPLVQLRIMTTNAVGNDEAIGIDDISVRESLVRTAPTGTGLANPATVTAGSPTLLTVNVTPGANPDSTGLIVSADLREIGGLGDQLFSDDGVTDGDVTAGDNVFSFRATVSSATAPGPKTLAATIVDSESRMGMAAIQLVVEAPIPELTIAQIQGSGPTSPFVGQTVRTTGIVTGIRPSSFYIQMPGGDGDPDTSDGLLIFRTTLPGQLLRGDLVRVTGRVLEFVPAADPESRPVTEIGQLPFVEVLDRGLDLPDHVTLTPADAPAGSTNLDLLERYEGMRVHVEELRVVAPTGFMAMNETGLPPTALPSTSNGVFVGMVADVARPFREPGLDPFEPEPPGLPPCMPPSPCVPRFDGNPERIRVDSDAQLNGVRLEVAAGQTVHDVVGPLDYESATWSIALDPPSPPGYQITPQQVTALAVDPPASGQFTVASFNLQRLFDTINDPTISEPVLTQARLAHRLNKLSLLVRNVLRNPDVLGVAEAENLGVLQALAAKITADANAAGQPDPGYAAYLIEGNDIGGIDVGFLVRSTRVEVVELVQEGKDETFTFPPPPAPGGVTALLNDRPPLVLRALVRGSSGDPLPITVIANHLRSLLDVTDPDEGPRVRFKRRAQAEFLANLIQARQLTDPSERIIVLGDMNAFQFNDGLVDSIGTIKGTPTPPDEVLLSSPDLVDPDLINLVETVPAEQRYSFVFSGSAQELDHILITQNLAPRLASLQYGRANADFPDSLRNDANRAERTSDHDPLVAYLTTPSLSIDDVTVAEGDEGVTQARFTVTLHRAPEDEVSVRFATEDGEGENGAVGRLDYITREGELTFRPGETTQTIVVDVIGDRVFEPNEIFRVRLSDASPNASLDRMVGTGTITNDDPEPSMSIGNAAVSERAGTATFTVSLSNPSASTITVAFETADRTARQPDDYTAASGVLEFAPGETAQTVHVTIAGDLLDEPDETFFVNLSNAVNGTILDGQGIGTIEDDDPQPKIRIEHAHADEPAPGATAPMTFRVALSAPSGREVAVDFRTFNLTAVAGHDYLAQAGTLRFAPGQVEQTIEVPILGDHRQEFIELFLVVLFNPVNGTVADAIGLGIIDDARGPRVDGFSPTGGRRGTAVVITGANFKGALLVRFNGVPTLFHVDSPGRIRAIVPNGAQTGPISVTTPRGTGVSGSPFVVLPGT